MDELSMMEFICYLLMISLVFVAFWLHKKTEMTDEIIDEKIEEFERDIET